MLKKFTALLLISAFTHAYAFTPIAQPGSLEEEVNRTFDDLNYKLNVEWNQKDISFFEKTMDEFDKNITSLKNDGVTDSDLVNQALEKIKDKQIQSEVAELARTIDENQLTNSEAKEFVLSKLASTYSSGASWSGHRMGHGTAIIIGAILIILCVCKDHGNKSDPRPRPRPCDGYDHQGPGPMSFTNGGDTQVCVM